MLHVYLLPRRGWFSVNVWAVNVKDFLIGPYFLPPWFNDTSLKMADESTSANKASSYCPQSNMNNFNLNSEVERRKTFETWPVHLPVDPDRLAKAGFYYLGYDDEVVCFSCNGHIKDWNYGDVVLAKHAKLFPNCAFIQQKSNNIPICKFPAKSKEETPIIEDTMNKCGTLFNFESMKLESERLKTFSGKWPLSFINVSELVNAGFFYIGVDDKVQCPYCKGIISSWAPNDIPMQEHMKHFPWCSYVSESLCKNLNPGKLWFKSGEDVCGNMKSQRNTEVEYTSNVRLLDLDQQHLTLEELGVHLHKGPIHPQQTSLTARLNSFATWPNSSPVSKEDLAAAGFFYLGISDHTKCFHCNGGLCNWEEGDNPWVEHARWFCNCDFLRLTKGSDFIKSCLQEKSPQLSKNLKSTRKSLDNIQDLMKTVDETMKSSLIKYVLETELFPYYIVRAAVLLQVKETGASFATINELCNAISCLKEEMEREPLNVKTMELSDLNVCENVEKNCVIEEKVANETVSPEAKTILMEDNQAKSGLKSLSCSTNEDLSKDHRLCKICMDNEIGVVFLPCGHLLSCTVCAPALKYCPMCRKTIQATVRAYFN